MKTTIIFLTIPVKIAQYSKGLLQTALKFAEMVFFSIPIVPDTNAMMEIILMVMDVIRIVKKSRIFIVPGLTPSLLTNALK